MDFLVDALISLTRFFGGSLGLTLIFIGVFSRVIFYPLLKSGYKHLELQRQLKPKLDALKKKYANDKQRLGQEQAKLMLASGVNPLAGCLPFLVQIIVAIILFNALGSVIRSGIETHFWIWDLGNPDAYKVGGIPVALPGVLTIFYALSTLVQSKMMIPEPVKIEKSDSPREVEKKADFAEALTASQGQMVFLTPLLILFVASLFPAGLTLFFFVNTVTGIVLQYKISGWGGLQPWLKILKR